MAKESPKEKSSGLVSSNSLSREISAGGVVFKKIKTQKSNVKIKWLVTKASPSELYPESYWRLPKGWIDDDEDGKRPGPLASGVRRAGEIDLQKTAVREVREEAGVSARVVKKVGTEKYFYVSKGKRILKFVTFYLMEWQEDLAAGPGFETSEIIWTSFDEARKKLKHSGEKKILNGAKKLFEQETQENLI